MSVNQSEAMRLIKLGRRADALKGCLTALLKVAALHLWLAWLFMVAVGIAHAEWLPQLPTIGFWWALLLVFMTRGLLVSSTSSSKPSTSQ